MRRKVRTMALPAASTSGGTLRVMQYQMSQSSLTASITPVE